MNNSNQDMNEPDEDKYIKLLEILKKRLDNNKGTNYAGFHEMATKLEIPMQLIDRTAMKIFDLQVHNVRRFDSQFLSLEAYFNLLDYHELKQAKEDSKDAKLESIKAIKWAKIAMWISALLALIQIIISLKDPSLFQAF